MESRDARYGWAADDPRWTEQPDGARDGWPRPGAPDALTGLPTPSQPTPSQPTPTQPLPSRPVPGQPSNGGLTPPMTGPPVPGRASLPAPNLWPDASGNDTTTEYNTETWLPQQRPPTWSVVYDERWGPPPDRWGQDPSASTLPLAPVPPPLYGASGLPNPPAPSNPVRPGYGLVTPPERINGQARALPAGRRPRRRDDEFRRASTDERGYGRLLGLTLCWYALPGLLYVVWLVTAGSNRVAATGSTFASSLPWLLGAIVLSLAVAGLLRWAVVGWRALTLSFAAAIIGAGVATIAHSLTL